MLEHIGINTASPEEAERLAKLLSFLLNLESRHGQKSEFTDPYFEYMKQPFLGSRGHAMMCTENLQSAVEELREEGFSFHMETVTYFEGSGTKNVYPDGRYGGFAIHIMRE